MSKYKGPQSWKEVVNNALQRLISTGQISLVALFLPMGLMVYRTPSENIVEVWRVLGKMLEYRNGLGYALAGVCGAGWVAHSRLQRRRAEKEIQRICAERNDAQQRHFDKTLRSSKK